MRIKFLEVDGIRTRLLYAGETGRYPILYLHGFGVSADTWLHNIDPLADAFFVCAPDMVGHGFTDPVDFAGAPPHAQTVRHLCRLVDDLGFERFCVSGSSYGGLIGALMYFEMPDRVDRLVINGRGSCFNTEAELAEALEGALKNAKPAITDPTLESCRRRLANILHDPAAVPEAVLLAQLTSYAQPWIASSWEQAIRGMMNAEAARPHRILDRLEQLDVETLVVWGLQDVRGKIESARAGLARMPRGRLVTFDNCGHMPYMEHPARYNEMLRGFLNE